MLSFSVWNDIVYLSVWLNVGYVMELDNFFFILLVDFII